MSAEDLLEELLESGLEADNIEISIDQVSVSVLVDGAVDAGVEETADVDDVVEADDQAEPEADAVAVDEPDVDDVVGELACDVDSCDFTTSSERGLSVHESRVHRDDSSDTDAPSSAVDALPDPARETFETIGELGEASVSQLAEAGDVAQGTIHYRLSALRKAGLIDSRQPEGSQTKLYRHAGTDPIEEPETDENAPSTEDDELSEAPDVDLEDEGADDGAEDDGAVDDQETNDADVDAGDEEPDDPFLRAAAKRRAIPPEEPDASEDEVTPDDVLEAIEQLVDEGSSWIKASELSNRFDVTPQKIGACLRALRGDGRIEKHNDNAVIAAWRPVVETAEDGREAGEHTSTEDDTQPEAPDVDLEEDEPADRDADVDAGDQESDLRYSCGDCDFETDTGLEHAIHRTEEHGATQGTLGYLEPGEFEAAVNDATSVADISESVGWSLERTIRALNIYGLDDVVGPDGIELSDLNDWDFDGLEPLTEDVQEDVDDDPETDPEPEPAPSSARADGGAVAFADYSAASGTSRYCANCGSHVDKKFAKIYEDDEGEIRACPNCPDLFRESDGQTIRLKRDGSRGVGR